MWSMYSDFKKVVNQSWETFKKYILIFLNFMVPRKKKRNPYLLKNKSMSVLRGWVLILSKEHKRIYRTRKKKIPTGNINLIKYINGFRRFSLVRPCSMFMFDRKCSYNLKYKQWNQFSLIGQQAVNRRKLKNYAGNACL